MSSRVCIRHRPVRATCESVTQRNVSFWLHASRWQLWLRRRGEKSQPWTPWLPYTCCEGRWRSLRDSRLAMRPGVHDDFAHYYTRPMKFSLTRNPHSLVMPWSHVVVMLMNRLRFIIFATIESESSACMSDSALASEGLLMHRVPRARPPRLRTHSPIFCSFTLWYFCDSSPSVTTLVSEGCQLRVARSLPGLCHAFGISLA